MNRRLLLLTLLALPLYGCVDPCAGADFGHGNPAYAGTYSGLFHNSGGTAAAKDLTFSLTIDAASQVAGSVTEAETGRTATVTGHVSDFEFACSSDRTMLELRFTFESEAPRTLSCDRNTGQSQPWPFTARYQLNSSPIGTGKLTLTKQ